MQGRSFQVTKGNNPIRVIKRDTMDNLRIIKVKLKGSVFISYDKRNEDKNWDSFHIESDDTPKGSFVDVFHGFEDDVDDICNFKDQGEQRLKVHEINFDHKGGLKVSMSCSKYLEHIETSFDFKTPKLPLPVKDDDGELRTLASLPESYIELVDLLRDECIDYINGDRLGQLQIPFDKNLNLNDELFEDAVKIVIEKEYGSLSLIQRSLKIGYSRAGGLMALMEKRGVISPYKGNASRDVLIGDISEVEYA